VVCGSIKIEDSRSESKEQRRDKKLERQVEEKNWISGKQGKSKVYV